MSDLVRVIEDAGDGQVLVYVPGVDGSGELLLHTAEALKQSFRLVRLSYASAPLPSLEGGYAEMADSIARVLDDLGVERCILLAESFGVALAVQTALSHPERIGAMGLLNGFVHFPARWKIALTNLLLPLMPPPLFRLGRRLTIPRVMLAPRSDPDIARAMLDSVGDYFDSAFLRRLQMIRGLDLRRELHGVRCPVTLFASSHDQVVPSVSAAREMARLISDAQLEILDGAGHVILPFADQLWVRRLQELASRS